jgi:hypothetical protein
MLVDAEIAVSEHLVPPRCRAFGNCKCYRIATPVL